MSEQEENLRYVIESKDYVIKRLTRDIHRLIAERNGAREAARWLLENAEDVAAGRCGDMYLAAWPWLKEVSGE